MSEVLEWRPDRGQQTRFLRCAAFEVLFGGAAGPGKTECLVVGALRQIENPAYNGIILRRTFTRLESADGPIARSSKYYPALGGDYNTQKHYWEFPSGARIYFGHMEHEDDKLQYQSAQFQYIGFDEATEFTFSQYYFMFTRCRAPIESGLRCFMRAATNPGGVGHRWVKDRFITKDIVNQVKHFALINEVDTRVSKTHPQALSRAYFPALLSDNSHADPNYLRNLLNNPDPVERARLAAGDWDIEVTEGRIYPNWTTRNISESAEYDPNLELYWAVDDGYHNPRVILFCQIKPDGTVIVCNEYYAREQTAPQTLNFISNRDGSQTTLLYPYPKPDVVYFDPSAVQFAAQCWEPEFDLFTSPADNRVQEGIKVVRQYIQDTNGVVSLLVHPRCVNLIREMTLYMADLKKAVMGSDPPPIKDNDHCPDALRYFIATHAHAIPRFSRS